MAAAPEDEDSVFINCPFTADYKQLFHSIIFTVLSCGFRPRTAMEAGDAGDIRLDKIARLITESAYRGSAGIREKYSRIRFKFLMLRAFLLHTPLRPRSGLLALRVETE